MEKSSKKFIFSFLFCLVLLSTFASASWFQDMLGSFGLGSYVSGENVPSDYKYLDQRSTIISSLGDCEVIQSNAYQYKVFSVYSSYVSGKKCEQVSTGLWGMTSTVCTNITSYSSTPLFSGTVQPNGYHQYCVNNPSDKSLLPLKIIVKIYEKAVVNDHSTKIYKLDFSSNTYKFWMTQDKISYPEYWCSDATKNRYLDMTANNQKSVCATSAPSVSIYTGAECFKQGGVQFNDCEAEEEYGLMYQKLFDIDGSDLDCCKATFTNYYGGDIDNGQVFKDDSVASGLGYLGGAVVSGTGAILGDASAKFLESFIKSMMQSVVGKIIMLVILLVLLVFLLGIYLKYLHPLLSRLF